MKLDRFIAPPNTNISLQDYDPTYTDNILNKKAAKELLEQGKKELAYYQEILYAQNIYGILIILQGMDAAGKDSVIKHVMSGINPQGCQVFSFKQPSNEELDHDYMWRYLKVLPERGRIGIFNRSYYEEVLVVRVHPELLNKQQLPLEKKQNKLIWQERFEQINNIENYLVNNGIIVLKFFLNLSKEEQRKRFLDRINRPEKNWKFSISDIQERNFWADYMQAYEDAFTHTSSESAPWYIVPADHKWFTRLVVAKIIIKRIQALDLKYPELTPEQKQALLAAKKYLT